MTEQPAKSEKTQKTDTSAEPSLKLRTARTLKWNTIDRVASQLLYAVIGVVLANVLNKEDFGLVGVLLVFQAFAMLFVDSGFGAALLQKKEPTQRDYSTVFWFNLGVSVTVYIILWFCAPVIADIFQGDKRLISLSKLMFTAFVINGLAIVQTNRLMKKMDVKQIAISNSVGLVVSGVVGVWLALTGYGAWALVWQTVSLACVKTGWLWITGHWLPSLQFSKRSLKEILPVGASVFSSSMLNTICLNIYSFVIGAFYNLASLGVYTQADKWSKMGSASLSQIMTASFVPLLSKFQDSDNDFHRYMKRINRFASFIVFPALIGLAIIGTPLFHTLFGTKWDAAIVLFQILSIRGIFIVLLSLCNNYLLALERAKALVVVEIVKDVLILVTIFATVFYKDVEILVWGQLVASVVTYGVVLVITSRATHYSVRQMLADMMPFCVISILMGAVGLSMMRFTGISILQLLLQFAACLLFYYLAMRIGRFPELSEGQEYLLGRFRRK